MVDEKYFVFVLRVAFGWAVTRRSFNGCNTSQVLFRLDELAQGAQPRFVASPASDGGAIDRLTGLPLAGRLHSPRIALRAQARVMPREAAGSDDPPDTWFGIAGQFFVINFNEAVRRQHTPPMGAEPLVVAEIRDQFRASGRKRQDRMEMSLMDRQRGVDRSATAVDDGCARECEVDQPSPKEVERHLVGYSVCRRRDRAQYAEIV